MRKETDDPQISRSKLCDIAEVERGKHVRWTGEAELLPDHERFGTLDVVRAAMLDELNTALKPSKAARVWRQIRDEVRLPGARLEVIVDVATCRARVARTDAELLAALTRRQQLVVLPLHERANRALERLREYRSSAENETSSSRPARSGEVTRPGGARAGGRTEPTQR